MGKQGRDGTAARGTNSEEAFGTILMREKWRGRVIRVEEGV